jgi:hypothetical protein
MWFHIRWAWNIVHYRLGLTHMSPALHEARRMFKKLNIQQINRTKTKK